MKVRQLLSEFGYVIFSNLLSFFISALVVLFVPKVVGVAEYGYWQLFVLYSSLLGIFQMGWLDGIYLRYGGREYKSLDKKIFFSQFVMMTLLQVFFMIVLLVSIFSLAIITINLLLHL